MPLSIPNTTLQDDYTEATTFAGTDVLATGWFVVANNPAAITLLVNQGGYRQGMSSPFPEQYLAPGTYPLNPGSKLAVAGIKARNYIAGKPVQFFGAMYYPGEPYIASGQEYSGTVAPGGGIGPPPVTGIFYDFLNTGDWLSIAATTPGPSGFDFDLQITTDWRIQVGGDITSDGSGMNLRTVGGGFSLDTASGGLELKSGGGGIDILSQGGGIQINPGTGGTGHLQTPGNGVDVRWANNAAIGELEVRSDRISFYFGGVPIAKQPAPVTLGDVILVLQNLGLCS